MSREDHPKPPQQSRIEDARGRAMPLLDPYELHLLRRHDVIPAEPLRSIADEVGFGMPKWQRGGYLASVFAFTAGIVFLVFWKLARGIGIDAVERVLWPVNLAIFAIGAVQFWRGGRRARAGKACEIMLRHRRCPQCGYDIRGLPMDPSDCATICPECGAAWRIPSDYEPPEPQDRRPGT